MGAVVPGQRKVDQRLAADVEVVQRPADDGVVVHAHVDVDHADGVAEAWGRGVVKWKILN